MIERACVYTVLFGGYEDLLEQPIAAESELDFICFTDDPELQSNGWRVVQVEPLFAADPSRSSRYHKILAHKFLDGYDESLYIDNSILLLRPPERLLEHLLPGNASLGAVAHSFRETVEDEFAAVMAAGFDVEWACLEQLEHYRRYHRDVLSRRPLAAGILARRHLRPEVVEAMERWWYHVLRYSRRDQLSFLVALSETSVEPVVAELDFHHNRYFRWPASTGRKALNDEQGGFLDEWSKLKSALEAVEGERSKLESALVAVEGERSKLEVYVRVLEADREDAGQRLEAISAELEDERRFGPRRWAIEHSWSDRVRLAFPQRWGLLNRAMKERW